MTPPFHFPQEISQSQAAFPDAVSRAHTQEDVHGMSHYFIIIKPVHSLDADLFGHVCHRWRLLPASVWSLRHWSHLNSPLVPQPDCNERATLNVPFPSCHRLHAHTLTTAVPLALFRTNSTLLSPCCLTIVKFSLCQNPPPAPVSSPLQWPWPILWCSLGCYGAENQPFKQKQSDKFADRKLKLHCHQHIRNK